MDTLPRLIYKDGAAVCQFVGWINNQRSTERKITTCDVRRKCCTFSFLHVVIPSTQQPITKLFLHNVHPQHPLLSVSTSLCTAAAEVSTAMNKSTNTPPLAASVVRQLPSAARNVSPAFNVWLLGLLCSGSAGLEFATGQTRDSHRDPTHSSDSF